MHDLSYLHVMMKQIFRNVYVVKPESSRALSAESFVVGIGFIPDANLTLLSESITVLPTSTPTAAIEGTGTSHTGSSAAEESKDAQPDEEEEDKLTF